MLRSRWFQATTVIALLVTPLFLFGDRALAVQDSEDKVLFGPFTVGVAQGARLNVAVIGNPDELPWDFVVRVFNRRGDVVQERKFQVAPNAIGSFEINVGSPGIVPVDRLGRLTMRAEVVGFNPQPDPPGQYTATLEIYSQLTGHTSIFIGNPDILPAARIGPPPGSSN